MNSKMTGGRQNLLYMLNNMFFVLQGKLKIFFHKRQSILRKPGLFPVSAGGIRQGRQ